LAASSSQQPELALQGMLFGLESAAPQPASGPGGDSPSCDPLDEAALEADATRRPRQRQQSQTSALASTAASGGDPAEAADNDLPPWHHHSLVEAQQLTPMLRHYVELKAAHPERVLLYRLGDFFECFFEDAMRCACNSSGEHAVYRAHHKRAGGREHAGWEATPRGGGARCDHSTNTP